MNKIFLTLLRIVCYWIVINIVGVILGSSLSAPLVTGLIVIVSTIVIPIFFIIKTVKKSDLSVIPSPSAIAQPPTTFTANSYSPEPVPAKSTGNRILKWIPWTTIVVVVVIVGLFFAANQYLDYAKASLFFNGNRDAMKEFRRADEITLKAINSGKVDYSECLNLSPENKQICLMQLSDLSPDKAICQNMSPDLYRPESIFSQENCYVYSALRLNEPQVCDTVQLKDDCNMKFAIRDRLSKACPLLFENNQYPNEDLCAASILKTNDASACQYLTADFQRKQCVDAVKRRVDSQTRLQEMKKSIAQVEAVFDASKNNSCNYDQISNGVNEGVFERQPCIFVKNGNDITIKFKNHSYNPIVFKEGATASDSFGRCTNVTITNVQGADYFDLDIDQGIDLYVNFHCDAGDFSKTKIIVFMVPFSGMGVFNTTYRMRL